LIAHQYTFATIAHLQRLQDDGAMGRPVDGVDLGQVDEAQVDAVMEAARLLVAVVAASVLEVEERASLPQLRVLTLMAAHGSLTLGAVASALGVHPSNATRMCDRLVSAGLVDRQDDPDDRRQLRLTLTGAGRALVEEVMSHRRTAVRRAMAGMTEAERVRLAESLGSFAAAAFGLIDEDPALGLSWV
jgi:DNA-binding MarR family transcriptional regulator